MLYQLTKSEAMYKQAPRKNSCSVLIAILFALAFALTPSMVQAIEVDPLLIQDTEISISNFGKVSPLIWRGGVPSDKGLEQLAGQGIKTIIDLRCDGKGCKHEEQMVSKLGLKYVHLPMGFSRPEQAKIIAFLKTVNEPANLPVFIHCRQGADRTGTLVGIYRIFIQNWKFDKTYSEMRTYHFKPWLFSMKKRVARVADDNLTRQAIQIALNDQSSNTGLKVSP